MSSNAQIGLPLVTITTQRIVVRTQWWWVSLVGNGDIEHAAQGDGIDITGMNSKADDASCVLFHNDKYPKGSMVGWIHIETSSYSRDYLSNCPESSTRIGRVR